MEPEKVRACIAFLIVVGFLAIMGCWFVLPMKGDPQTFVQMLGTLGSGGFMVIVAYYFGSSSGSKSKDDTLAKLASNDNGRERPAAPPAPTAEPTTRTGT